MDTRDLDLGPASDGPLLAELEHGPLEDEFPSGAFERVRALILQEIAGRPGPGKGDFELSDRVEELLLSEGHLWPKKMVRRFTDRIEDELFGLGPLEPLMRDPEVTEIMINGPERVFVERGGRITLHPVSLGTPQRVLELVRRVIGPLNLRLDETSPMVDARLPDGSRLNAVVPPLCLNGPTVTIRRFRKRPFSLEELIRLGTVTDRLAAFLSESISHRANILVSGGTSTGKTTLLNLLASFVPPGERLVTIEDTAELRIEHPHVVSLESRPPSIEGKGEVTVRELVRNALRMRPDRIIVGEVRGAEALDMLQAMNTGHPGSLTTAHANSAVELLNRLETMVLMSDVRLDLVAVRRQIASALDLIVHLERGADGRRYVKEVSALSCDPKTEYRLETLVGRE